MKIGFEKESFETIYPDGLEFVPKKFAIIHRNRWIVDHSDYLITYISINFGGAYNITEYAKRKKKNIINLKEQMIFEPDRKL